MKDKKIETLDFEEKSSKKNKLLLKLFLVMLLFIVFIYIIFSYFLSPVSSKGEVINFSVDSGSSVYSVGQKLEKEGIIRNYLAYKIYVKLHHVSSYKAGIYKLDKSYSTKDIVKILSGNYYKDDGITITFKEGKNIRQVAKEVAKNTDITESSFIAKMEDEVFINSLIEKYWFLTDDVKNKDIYYPLEGYLFPDTYSFKKDVNEEEIIMSMLDQTDKIFSKYKSLIDANSYSIHQLATVASMVELEGKTPNDRKNIAGVFYNRLSANISLGSDVTTYYALKVDLNERSLTAAEFNTVNPYNTRQVSMVGLPVGPICNFSESSLDAAVEPSKNDYYFFVADKNGKVHFTKTNDEHLKVIKELKSAGNWIE